MMHLCYNIIDALRGMTLVTAESCTGGGIGQALTAVPGSSAVYKGGIICYTNWVKETVLHVPSDILEQKGAVSAEVAKAMAKGAREVLQADVAISVTGLAGPSGDEYGNPVGTVYVGYSDRRHTVAREYQFTGNREEVRRQATRAALELIFEFNI